MPKAEQSSSTKADVKFAPQSLSNFAGMPNTVINHSYRICVMVLAFWSLVMKAMAYLMKWSVRTKTFLMLGVLLSSMVVLMLVKST